MFKTVKTTMINKGFDKINEAFDKFSESIGTAFDGSEADESTVTNDKVTVIVKGSDIAIQGAPTSITLNGEKLK